MAMSKDAVEIKFYKDLVHKPPENLKLPGFLEACLAGLSLWVNVPLIGTLCRQSFFIVCTAMIRFRKMGQYSRLYHLLTQCLIGKSFRKYPKEWWYLMRAAVAFTQERQHYYLTKDLALEDSLILLGHLGPKPLKGYDAAYVFVGYSLWHFERGDIHTALNFIKIAEAADPSWGYPVYLHGWYSLFDQSADSADYFSRAVQMDWSFLHKMKQDSICKEHPEVLHEVRRRALVSRSR
jgi:hypothetical protein